MPGSEHEAITQLFHAQPEFAADLLRQLDAPVPEFTEARLASEDFTEWSPTESHADVVIVLTSREPVLAVVVEVQRSRDPDKRRSWPVYLSTLYARHDCPAILLVVCPDHSIATWCARPIKIGHPGWDLVPLVLGPDLIPIIIDPAVAARQPALTVLSAIAHGDKPDGKAVLQALLDALGSIDPEVAQRYTDVTLVGLSVAARQKMEELMTNGEYEFMSDFFRNYISVGEAENREAKAEAKSVIKVLVGRGIRLPDEARERILSCTDRDQLDLWLRRAGTVTAADELFEIEHA